MTKQGKDLKVKVYRNLTDLVVVEYQRKQVASLYKVLLINNCSNLKHNTVDHSMSQSLKCSSVNNWNYKGNEWH